MLELENGQKVKIKFNTLTINDTELTCTVKWYENDRVSLVFPEDSEQYIKDFPEGREIEVVIYTNSGIFVFDSIVINSPLENDFVIELPDEKKKVQRRDYIRAHAGLKLVIHREDKKYETRTINVGGGGIRFITEEKLDINELWNFSLFLPGNNVITGLGKVLYTILRGKLMASVITFTDIKETDRNRLIKFCLDEEIKNLKFKKLS